MHPCWPQRREARLGKTKHRPPHVCFAAKDSEQVRSSPAVPWRVTQYPSWGWRGAASSTRRRKSKKLQRACVPCSARVEVAVDLSKPFVAAWGAINPGRRRVHSRLRRVPKLLEHSRSAPPATSRQASAQPSLPVVNVEAAIRARWRATRAAIPPTDQDS